MTRQIKRKIGAGKREKFLAVRNFFYFRDLTEVRELNNFNLAADQNINKRKQGTSFLFCSLKKLIQHFLRSKKET